MSSPAPRPALSDSAPAARKFSPPFSEIVARSVLTLCLAIIAALTLVLALAATRPEAADDLVDRLQALIAAHTRPASTTARMPPFCPSDATSSSAIHVTDRLSSFVESIHSMDAEQLQYACEHRLEDLRCVFVDAESAGERTPLLTDISEENDSASAHSGAYGGSSELLRDASHGSAAHPVATVTDALRALALHRVRARAALALKPSREQVVLRAGMYYVGATGGAFVLPLEFENVDIVALPGESVLLVGGINVEHTRWSLLDPSQALNRSGRNTDERLHCTMVEPDRFWALNIGAKSRIQMRPVIHSPHANSDSSAYGMEVCSCASSAAPAQVAVPPVITIDVPDDIMHTIHAHMRAIGAIERYNPPQQSFRHAFDSAPLNLTWWNSVGWTWLPSNAPALTFKQRLLRALWRPIFGDQEPRIAGVEYWHDMLSSDKLLHAHFDKDEALRDHSGVISTPELGAVFYPFMRGMRGDAGRLRIFADQKAGAPSLMRAVASMRVHAGRMVLFDAGGRAHEVTPINAGGQRVHFGMNLWVARPWGVCKRGGMCFRHEARVEGRCQCWDGFETGAPEVDFDP